MNTDSIMKYISYLFTVISAGVLLYVALWLVRIAKVDITKASDVIIRSLLFNEYIMYLMFFGFSTAFFIITSCALRKWDLDF